MLAPATTPNHYPYSSYPRGWYRMLWASDVKVGKITPMHFFGQDLIAFRDANKQVSVLNAHCPHLGANFAFGGKVEDGLLVCPYHEWHFDGEGNCVKIPYAKKQKCDAVKAKKWHTVERNGCIYMYYHPRGLEPDHEVPVFKEIGHKDWTQFKTLSWKLRVHPFELIENGVDLSHFKSLHGFEEALHLEKMTMNQHDFTTHTTGRKKIAFKILKTEVFTQYIGSGITYMYVTGTWDIMVTSSVTPIDEQYSEVALQMCFHKSRFIPWDILKGFILQKTLFGTFTPDFKIWENRRYIEKPPVMVEDGPIIKVRNWCAQLLESSDEVIAITKKPSPTHLPTAKPDCPSSEGPATNYVQ